MLSDDLGRRSPVLLFDDQAHPVPSRDWLARRYLTAVERDALAAVPPREQRRWLDDRVAIKDAARLLWWDAGRGPLFPAELEVEVVARPTRVRGPDGDTLHVCADHHEHRSVAVASRAAGVAVTWVDGRVRCSWEGR